VPYLTDVKGFSRETVDNAIFPVSIYASLAFYVVAGRGEPTRVSPLTPTLITSLYNIHRRPAATQKPYTFHHHNLSFCASPATPAACVTPSPNPRTLITSLYTHPRRARSFM
jgi:hypothetical protein